MVQQKDGSQTSLKLMYKWGQTLLSVGTQKDNYIGLVWIESPMDNQLAIQI